jgi:predicted DNA-binding helix-hairpin-helix protein
MLRQYGFDVSELPFDSQGNLPDDRDPKLAWAMQHPESFPIDINRAPQAALLRVPGIGPQGAAAIVQARRSARLRSLEDLQRLGVRSRQAAPYILFDGRTPNHQLRLFTL